MKETIPPDISKAAAILGRKGGSATGPSKRRSLEQYRAMAQRSAQVRREKAKQRKES